MNLAVMRVSGCFLALGKQARRRGPGGELSSSSWAETGSLLQDGDEGLELGAIARVLVGHSRRVLCSCRSRHVGGLGVGFVELGGVAPITAAEREVRKRRWSSKSGGRCRARTRRVEGSLGQGWMLQLEDGRNADAATGDDETKIARRDWPPLSGDAETLDDEGTTARVGQTAFGWWPRKAVSALGRTSGGGGGCVVCRRAGAL